MRRYTQKQLQDAKKRVIKYGMGIHTTISSKHAWHFTERFREENAKVLEEAQKEYVEIYRKKRMKGRNSFLFNKK